MYVFRHRAVVSFLFQISTNFILESEGEGYGPGGEGDADDDFFQLEERNGNSPTPPPADATSKPPAADKEAGTEI